MIDPYPTRLPHPAAPIARIEPTVWGAACDGPLDQAALDGYSDAGHLLQPNTVTGARRAELDDELHTIAASLDTTDPRIIREADGSIRSVFEPHLISAAVKQMIELDTVLPVAQQLLGGDVYIHQARINYMSPFTSTGFYWHSDFETWHAEDGMPTMRAVSCVIALTDNYPHNGTLMTINGTNSTFYPCVGATPADNHATSLAGQTVGVPDRETLTAAATRGINQFVGPAGTGFWFDCNTLHGSGSNITPFPRSNLFLVFNSVDNRLVEPFAAPKPRPPYLGAR
jgi:ectoine hydroxylase